MSKLDPYPGWGLGLRAESKMEGSEKLAVSTKGIMKMQSCRSEVQVYWLNYVWVRDLRSKVWEAWPQGYIKSCVARSSYDLCPKLTQSGSSQMLFIPHFKEWHSHSPTPKGLELIKLAENTHTHTHKMYLITWQLSIKLSMGSPPVAIKKIEPWSVWASDSLYNQHFKSIC